MAISYLSELPENINGGTIVNIGQTVDNNKNLSSARKNTNSIGSVVVQNEDVTKADAGGEFAYNSSTPINVLYTTSLAGLDKQISGNYPITNNTKVIRSSLASTAIREGLFNISTGKFETLPENDVYYTCPDDSIECFQIQPPEVLIDIPYSASGGELEQNGVWLRFREVPNNVDDLYQNWRTIYVPSTSLATSSGVSEGDPNTNSTFKTPNLNQVLPNGSYQIEYDTTVNYNDVSKNFVGRIKSNAQVTNSSIASILQVTLNSDVELPSLEFDPDGDGIGNYTNPLLPIELQMEQFNIIAANQSKVDGVFTGALNSTFTIGTETANGQGKSVGSTSIPVVISLTDPSTGASYYDNYTINVGIEAQGLVIDKVDVVIASETYRNGTQTALAFSLP